MSEVEGKHSVNIRLEDKDFDYLIKESAKIDSNPTKLAHDLLRTIIKIRKKSNIPGNLTSPLTLHSRPITPSAQPTSPTTPPTYADKTNAGHEARETLNKRNAQKKGFFSRLFNKK